MSTSKKTKLGKTRLDKFYHLAKEQGFRSRAAYKLIQLNKKYNFLNNAKAVLDLCAAPGSWMQVAAKHMPMSSILVGVDLDPIKPIRNAVSLQNDITTQSCRQEIKKSLNDYKCDVVLHDGAPNVGKAWVQDAYSQAELVLAALKLATEFLIGGGWFVTKVFRSGEYNSLMYVFQQLFKRVEATKPAASRNTSAEIFVVCKGFLNPKKIDPRLLDPKFAFKEVEQDLVRSIFSKPKRKPSQVGYEEGNYILFKKTTVSEWVDSSEPVKMLGTYNQIEFDEASEIYRKHPLTTGEIQALLYDLKLCSKIDFKNLLKWRTKMTELKGSKKDKDMKEKTDEEKEDDEVSSKELTPEEEEDKLSRELDEELARIEKEKKKKKRKINIEKAKRQRKVDAGIFLLNDQLDVKERDLFELNKIRSDRDLEDLADVEAPDFNPNDDHVELLHAAVDETDVRSDNSDAEGEGSEGNQRYLEKQAEMFEKQYEEKLENTKTKSAKRKLAKKRERDRKQEEEEIRKIEEEESAKKKRQKIEGTGKTNPRLGMNVEDIVFETEEESKKSRQDSSDEDREDSEDEFFRTNSLVVKDTEPSKAISKTASMWFSQGLFSEMEKTEQKLNDDGKIKENSSNQRKRRRIDDSSDEDEYDTDEEIHRMRKEESKKNQKNKKKNGKKDASSSSDSDGERNDRKSKEIPFEVVPKEKELSDMEDMDEEDRITALAIGTALIRNPGLKEEMIDRSFNRYAFDDRDLPTWFVDGERDHNQPQLPITKEQVTEAKLKAKQLDATPIKKVAEARARKKLAELREQKRASDRALQIAENSEMTPSQKTKAIEELYKKKKKKDKWEKKYVPMRKHLKGKLPTGSKEKGKKTVMVDSRMKKDKKIAKGKAKAAKKGKRRK